MAVHLVYLRKLIQQKLTPGNLLLAIVLVVCAGRTFERFDPSGLKYKLIVDGLSLAAACLFIVYIYIAFAAQKRAKSAKTKK